MYGHFRKSPPITVIGSSGQRRGRKNFCLQKSRMPLAGLVYFPLNFDVVPKIQFMNRQYCYWLRWTIQLLEEVRPVGFRMVTSSSVYRLWDRQKFYFGFRPCWFSHQLRKQYLFLISISLLVVYRSTGCTLVEVLMHTLYESVSLRNVTFCWNSKAKISISVTPLS